MFRQAFCVSCYGVGVLALFYMSAPVYALLVAGALIVASCADQVVAYAIGLFGDENADDPAKLQDLCRRISD